VEILSDGDRGDIERIREVADSGPTALFDDPGDLLLALACEHLLAIARLHPARISFGRAAAVHPGRCTVTLQVLAYRDSRREAIELSTMEIESNRNLWQADGYRR
jgi:hypothetical protein